MVSLLLHNVFTQVEHKKSCRDDMDTRISKEYYLIYRYIQNSLVRQRSTRITWVESKDHVQNLVSESQKLLLWIVLNSIAYRTKAKDHYEYAAHRFLLKEKRS